MYFWQWPKEEQMHWRRIKAVVFHSWHHLTHSLETWMDIFWVPMIQALVFGGVAMFFAQSAGEAAQFIVFGILLWSGMEAGSYSIAVGALWEIWSRNFTNFFVSPLTLEEFIVGHIIFGLFKQFLTVSVLSIVVFAAFGFSLFAIGPTLPVHFFLLMVFGYAVGMLALGLILWFGTRIQSISWSLIYFIQPIVGVFYPISILPVWLQQIAFVFPPTYVFESARAAVISGVPQWNYLWLAFILDLIYLCAAYFFMKSAWDRARRRGTLAKIEE